MSLVAAYIVPHPPLAVPQVGRGEERRIQDTLNAYEEVARRIAAHNPQTVVILSPHTSYYQDWIHLSPGAQAHGSFAQFGAPHEQARIAYDTAFRDALVAAAEKDGIPAGTQGELHPELDHGVLVPLHFLARRFPLENARFVRVGGAALDRAQMAAFGALITQVAHALGRRTVLISSGDLSHKLTPDGPYGFDPAGPVFDEEFGQIVRSGNLERLLTMDRQTCEDAAECGLSGFCVLAGALRGFRHTSELLSLEGPFGVGYGVAAFEDLVSENDAAPHTGPSASAAAAPAPAAATAAAPAPAAVPANPVVDLAKRTVESWVRSHTTPSARERALPKDLPARAGAFVSLHTQDGELRGCIGTIFPTQKTLGDEIVQNAISASTRDPRFYPVTPDELAGLHFSVDILKEPEPCTKDMLDPQRYGVIVSTSDGRRGLLLPNLDGVTTVYQQVSIACRKAGIDYGHEPIELERFEVTRYEEE